VDFPNVGGDGVDVGAGGGGGREASGLGAANFECGGIWSLLLCVISGILLFVNFH
jgi:hypothetical protein